MKRTRNLRAHQPDNTMGWRELVGLPDFNIPELRAKIDTGARTSALHAENQEIFEQEGEKWVQFHFPLRGHAAKQILKAQVIDEREIKNTGGIPERRLIVRSTLLLGRHRWQIDVSLADREKMEFDLILGRTAFQRRGALIDPSRSYLMGQPGTGLPLNDKSAH